MCNCCNTRVSKIDCCSLIADTTLAVLKVSSNDAFFTPQFSTPVLFSTPSIPVVNCCCTPRHHNRHSSFLEAKFKRW